MGNCVYYPRVSQSVSCSLCTIDGVQVSLMAGFPGNSLVKSPPAKQEMQVWSLGQEDPPEKEMAAHSSILAWEIPWMEEPGGLRSMGLQKSQTRLSNSTITTLSLMASSLIGLTPRYMLSAITHKSLRSLLNSTRPCENGAITIQQITSVPCPGHRVVNETVTVPSYIKVLSSGRAYSKSL